MATRRTIHKAAALERQARSETQPAPSAATIISPRQLAVDAGGGLKAGPHRWSVASAAPCRVHDAVTAVAVA